MASPVLAEFEPSVAMRWNEANLDAIRRDFPAPTVHARNLFHVSVAMYDAWAAFDPKATGYFSREKVIGRGNIVQALAHEKPGGSSQGSPPAIGRSIEARRGGFKEAREEAISYAAYRVLSLRYAQAIGADESQASFDALMDELGYDINVTTTEGYTPAAIGNRIAAQIVLHCIPDGANELGGYADTTGYFPVNGPLIIDLPGAYPFYPNRWQPLAFEFQMTQNGIPLGKSVQKFVSPHWGYVDSFAIGDPDMYGLHYNLGAPPQLGGVGDQDFKDAVAEVILSSALLDPDAGNEIDISPGAFWNNSLGSNDGTGYPVNPTTGEPYEPNVVNHADWGRCIAEFWADGPHSETPPGHWNAIVNDLASHPLFERRIGGTGPVVSQLEWDVKLYFALNGAVHDGAVAAWGMKSHFDYVRPITMVRYMGGKGQSSHPPDANDPHPYRDAAYHAEGLPLIPGLIEVITPETRQTYHSHFPPSRLGKIAILAWGGEPDDAETEYTGAEWILPEYWLPYQRDTFVTPAFAAYVSGHSTFSRAAAEVLTLMTGDAYFPGGLGTYTFEAGEYLTFEDGPSEDLTLTWATYRDAADEAGRSRLYGGIHVYADDFDGRIIGVDIGEKAFALASKYFEGSMDVTADVNADGVVDGVDLARVLAAWGPCAGCPADFDRDGVVGAAELTEILVRFNSR